jgi:hypothetical protein
MHDDWLRGVLVQASELATIEGAPQTARVLACADRILRYMRHPEDWVQLSAEMLCVKDYVELIHARVGKRVALVWPRDELFVKRASIVSFVDEHCSLEEILARPGDYAISLTRAESGLVAEVRVTLEDGEREFTRLIPT